MYYTTNLCDILCLLEVLRPLPMATKRRTIDLLNPINPPADIWTNIYNWVFKVGRYILVGVEALLLIVFFSRFVMDEINNDLTKDINDKVTLLSNSQFRSQEIKYRNIHTLLLDVKDLEKKQVINSTLVAEIVSGVPSTLTLETFSFNNDKVSMNINTSNIKSVKDYEFSLRQNNKIKDVVVTLSKTGNSTSTLDVSITFNIVRGDKK